MNDMMVQISFSDLQTLKYKADKYDESERIARRATLVISDHAEWQRLADDGRTADAVKTLRNLIGGSLKGAHDVVRNYLKTGMVEIAE